ncbi:hypothetical protein [Paraburkholderia sp. HP33-1]|uniref:hypothetical protein n=1 Tax=Paraburkholderia sp. HP33-1 TaxID=2883243 RepID=UPI001F173E5C|nr:hypothetical protein [Paraburkholderia sp. HP33-1]
MGTTIYPPVFDVFSDALRCLCCQALTSDAQDRLVGWTSMFANVNSIAAKSSIVWAILRRSFIGHPGKKHGRKYDTYAMKKGTTATQQLNSVANKRLLVEDMIHIR